MQGWRKRRKLPGEQSAETNHGSTCSGGEFVASPREPLAACAPAGLAPQAGRAKRAFSPLRHLGLPINQPAGYGAAGQPRQAFHLWMAMGLFPLGTGRSPRAPRGCGEGDTAPAAGTMQEQRHRGGADGTLLRRAHVTLTQGLRSVCRYQTLLEGRAPIPPPGQACSEPRPRG